MAMAVCVCVSTTMLLNLSSTLFHSPFQSPSKRRRRKRIDKKPLQSFIHKRAPACCHQNPFMRCFFANVTELLWQHFSNNFSSLLLLKDEKWKQAIQKHSCSTLWGGDECTFVMTLFSKWGNCKVLAGFAFFLQARFFVIVDCVRLPFFPY